MRPQRDHTRIPREGLGTTAGLIVAPAGHHAVGTTLATDVIRLDRVPAMAIQVLYPPAES